MFSRSVQLFQQLSTLKHLIRIKPIAWLSRSTVKQNFGARLKRRVRNVFVISIVGVSTIYGYRQYHQYQWINEMNDFEKTFGTTKPRIIVLGTGWGAVSFLRHIDTHKYDVVCISPRNYFLMTPLLPSVTVGTVETRTVIESIRSLIGPRIKFVEAHCVNVDGKTKMITCNTASAKAPSQGDDNEIKSGYLPLKDEIGASSRVKLDSARTRPVFDMNYDILIVAIGSENNTFNTPGVKEHAHVLKELPDARRIRSAISDAFESAMTPTQTEDERKRLLHFVVVGGGPTGVEFAAELSDFIHEDLQHYFPRLVATDTKITLIQSLDHILSTMDKRISEYTEQHFRRENIEILTNTRVKEVKQQTVVVQAKGSTEFQSIPCALAIWATGIQARSLTNKIRNMIGVNIQNNRLGLLTDKYLCVKGINDNSMFAIGDCATIEQPKLLDRIQLLFEEADTEHRGALDLHQFQTLVEKKMTEFPQLEIFSKTIEKAFNEADKERSGYLTLSTLRLMLEKADQKARALPATAQVAYQEGRYVADYLNQINHLQTQDFPPFRYKHRGSLAYVGGDAAVFDLTDAQSLLDKLNYKALSGRSVNYLWKSYYFTEMFTGRTKTLLAFDWVSARLYGRDISRY